MPTVANESGLDRATLGNRNFLLVGVPHETVGSNYVIITDHREPAYLAGLAILKNYHGATLILVPDFGKLESDETAANAHLLNSHCPMSDDCLIDGYERKNAFLIASF